MKKIAHTFIVTALAASSSPGIVILVSDTELTSDINDFLTANFTNVTEIRNADYSNFAAAGTQDALNGTGAFAGSGAADLVILGRNLSSGAYSGGNADGYNGLAIPVVSFTSYIVRDLGDRMGWHTGSASNGLSTIGNETTLTAAGAAFFGAAGPVNWHESEGDAFNGYGTSLDVGGGEVLATLDGQLMSAYWNVGDAPGNPTAADVVTFPGERLLFNLDDDGLNGDPRNTFASLTPDGQAALVAGIDQISGLTVIPEPSSALLSLTSLMFLIRRKRR